MDAFRQLKSFYWSERKWFILSILTLILATALGLVYPNLLRYLIDDVIKQKNFELVPVLSLVLFGVIAIKALIQFIQGYSGAIFGLNTAFNLRNKLYNKLQTLSFQYYDTARTGELMSRLTADLEAVRMFLAFGFAQILNIVLMVTLGMAMMLSIDWVLTLITMITIPFLVMTALSFEKKVHPSFRNVRQALSMLTTAVQENIMGVRTVKSFAGEDNETKKFAERNDGFRSKNIQTAGIWSKYFPVMELIANLSVVILLAAGGYRVIQEHITIGEFVAFFSLIWFIIGPMWGLGYHINNYANCKASAERIIGLLNEHVNVQDVENPIVLSKDTIKGHVRFEDVTFSYRDSEPSVHHINIDAPAGSVIGILGGTGSGKSTLISLLMRAYNVNEGKITLDGVNIRNYQLQSLRREIATVFQETFLFSSTIRNNIAYGAKNVTMDEIIKAAKLAQAHDFIMELPLGYDTIVGERGLGLSGGQKQRIAIARALVINPHILLLDDATSAVDMETEHEIQSGFRELMKGRTTFIIAHRISSLRNADEIIVLDKGRIVQRGKHEELIQQEGPYLTTYNIQYADRPKQSELDSVPTAGKGGSR
ncbi:ABC transporter ATP-binding protein [Paenibacillus albiflavus]|uniref:ABC transporter ATP-binding protein n=1 Tax=Paenibacillus albiflavus TaxID=2545760 RepID=A0A4R4ERS7_9BACL|nr:ABC transporter ATP-binding protein [Paenibacillus albiflavus]TCZ81148.1 ABC transporter ATP-binding protein [Paenibacillus albiflavus]